MRVGGGQGRQWVHWVVPRWASPGTGAPPLQRKVEEKWWEEKGPEGCERTSPGRYDAAGQGVVGGAEGGMMLQGRAW